MKERLVGYITKLRAQAQLARARHGQADTRQRAIHWLQQRNGHDRPPSHVAERAPAPQSAPIHPPGALMVQEASTPGRRRRGQQSGDTLAALLRTDTESQQRAEQLWWKFTQWYLPAKRLDIQARRGQVQEERSDPADLPIQ